MLRAMVILSLAASITAESWLSSGSSAASEAQIRFAIENKYDGTGPGAQAPEYAYKTYQTIDEALVAYVNDPDTQLPELEKNRAIQKLTRPVYNTIVQQPIPRYQPKAVDEYAGYKHPQIKKLYPKIQEYMGYKPPIVQQSNIATDFTGWKPSQLVNHRKPISNLTYNKPRPVTSEPNYPKQHHKYGFQINDDDRPLENEISLGLPHFAPPGQEEFDPNPQYSFSYGVHDKGTGDSKSAHETRDGGTVRGYYTFMDADGKQRTVHYTADDKLGFRATVQRTHTNSQ